MKPPPANSTRSRIICAIIIVAAVALTFGRVCTNEWLTWDDQPLIYNNPLIVPPTASNLAKIWTQPHVRMYIPAVYTTWWTLARVATVPDDQTGAPSLNPWVFHTANLLVHTLSALIVFAILRTIIRDDTASCIGALLFALHPIQTEPIAWATGMKDLLCGLLALTAIWQYLEPESLPTPGGAERTRAHARQIHAIATICFTLSLLAKPSAVVTPFIAFAIETILQKSPAKQSLKRLAPWFLLIIPCLIWTKLAQPTPELIPPPLYQRPLIAIDAIGFYIFKLFVHAKLAIDYGLRPDVIIHTKWWIITAITVAIAAALPSCASATTQTSQRPSPRRIAAATLLIFTLGLAPVLGLTPFVFQWLSTLADRYLYLSMLGPAIATAFIVNGFQHKNTKTIAAAILLVLALKSFVQAGTWTDTETLARHALTINPQSPAANNTLGDVLYKREDIQTAHDLFARAVENAPNFLAARDNLALTLVRLNRPEEAIPLMKQTLEIRRNLPAILHQPIDQDVAHLKTVLHSVGRDEEANQLAPTTNNAPTR